MEYKISTIILSLLIFSGVVVGASAFYLNVAGNYGKTVEDLSTLDASTDITEMAEGMQSRLTDNPYKETPLEAFYAAGTAVWDSLNILTGSFALVGASINSIVTSIPLLVPAWLGALIVTAVILVMVFALASGMLKWRI